MSKIEIIKGGKKKMVKEYDSNVLVKLNDILDTYLEELKDGRNAQTRIDSLVLIKELVMILNMFADYRYKNITLDNEIKKAKGLT